jgi:hypothetical protein
LRPGGLCYWIEQNVPKSSGGSKTGAQGTAMMFRHVLLVLLAFAALLLALTSVEAQCADLIVEKRTFELPNDATLAGETINNVKIGWEPAGTLNADKLAYLTSGKRPKRSLRS